MPVSSHEKSSQHPFFSTLSPSENNGDAQIYRLFCITYCNTFTELADKLDVRAQVVSSTIKKVRTGGKIPSEWLLHLLRVYKISPEWILTGKGSWSLHDLAELGPQGISLEDREVLRPFSSQILMQEVLRRL